MSRNAPPREIRIKIVDFGEGSKVSAQLSLRRAGYDVDMISRSKLVRADAAEDVPDNIELADFPDEGGTHYLPVDPEAWAWLVGTWFVLRVGEHVVKDAYDVAKRMIADLHRTYPKAKIILSLTDDRRRPQAARRQQRRGRSRPRNAGDARKRRN
jgi:hypothetical protein